MVMVIAMAAQRRLPRCSGPQRACTCLAAPHSYRHRVTLSMGHPLRPPAAQGPTGGPASCPGVADGFAQDEAIALGLVLGQGSASCLSKKVQKWPPVCPTDGLPALLQQPLQSGPGSQKQPSRPQTPSRSPSSGVMGTDQRPRWAV